MQHLALDWPGTRQSVCYLFLVSILLLMYSFDIDFTISSGCYTCKYLFVKFSEIQIF